jgi:hypothetical protein
MFGPKIRENNPTRFFVALSFHCLMEAEVDTTPIRQPGIVEGAMCGKFKVTLGQKVLSIDAVFGSI